MNHDFSNEIPEMKEYLKENNIKLPAAKPMSYAELLIEKDYWKDKYYSLLEEHNKVIKDKYL